MSNTPPTTTPADDREAADLLARSEKALNGLENEIPAATPIVYKQVSYTAATFLPVLQAGAAPLQAVAKARTDLTTALTNRHENFEASKALINAFFDMLPQLLPPGTDQSQFGKKVPKARTPLTAEQTVSANQKRAATREARHIMGKKQRKAIKAPAPAAPDPTPPATAATATTTTTSGK